MPYLFAVNGGWGDWKPFGDCSKTCGYGTRTRSRECDNPPESNGGLDCRGDRTETSVCFEKDCPSKEDSRLKLTPNILLITYDNRKPYRIILVCYNFCRTWGME